MRFKAMAVFVEMVGWCSTVVCLLAFATDSAIACNSSVFYKDGPMAGVCMKPMAGLMLLHGQAFQNVM